MDLHLSGKTVRPTRAALREMERRGGGSIVIVGSVKAYFPDPGIYDYCATNAAVTNFAKALLKELAPRNIRVNSVSPGPVPTGLWMDEGPRCRRVRPRHRPNRRRGQGHHQGHHAHRPVHHAIRSLTWSSSLPATAPAIPPDLNSESTAASSLRSDAAQKPASRRPYSR
jgi:NAD(P)-dependent dehydrogenase (short-subunit alcohol dehydrogenase family)